MCWSWLFHGYLSLFHLSDILKPNNVLCVIYIHTDMYIYYCLFNICIRYGLLIRVQVVEARSQCVNIKSGNLKRLIIVSSYTTENPASRSDEHSSYGHWYQGLSGFYYILILWHHLPCYDVVENSPQRAYLNLHFGLPNL